MKPPFTKDMSIIIYLFIWNAILVLGMEQEKPNYLYFLFACTPGIYFYIEYFLHTQGEEKFGVIF